MSQESVVPRRTSTSAWASSLRTDRHVSRSKNFLNLNAPKRTLSKSKSKTPTSAAFKPKYVSIASLSTPVASQTGAARLNRADRSNSHNKENDEYSVMTQPLSDHDTSDWNQISHVSPLRQQISSAMKGHVSPHSMIDNLLSSPSFVLDDQVSFQDKFPARIEDSYTTSYTNSPRGNEVYGWEVDKPILTLEMILNRDPRRSKMNTYVTAPNGTATPQSNKIASKIYNLESTQVVDQSHLVLSNQSELSLRPHIQQRRIGDVALSLERIISKKRLLSVFSSWFKQYTMSRDLRESRENQVLSVLYEQAERYYVSKQLMKWRALHRHNMQHGKWRNLSPRTRRGALSMLFLSEIRSVWLLTSALYKFRIFLRKSRNYRKKVIKCYHWYETVAMTEAFGKLARNIAYKKELALHVVTIHDRVKSVRKQLWDNYMSDYYYTPYLLGLKTRGINRLKKWVDRRMVNNIKSRKAQRWFSMTYKAKALSALLSRRDWRFELVQRINSNKNVYDLILIRVWKKWLKKFKSLRRKVYSLYRSYDEADDFYEVSLYVRVLKRLIRLVVETKRRNSGYVDCAGVKYYMARLMRRALTQLEIAARNGTVNKQFLVLANHNYETVSMLRCWRVWMQKIYASRRLRRRERYKVAGGKQEEASKRVKVTYKNFRQQNHRNMV